MSEKWVLVDLDGSVADFETAVQVELAKMKSPGEPDYKIDMSKGFDGHPSWIMERMRVIKSVRGFWENLPPISFGVELYHAFEVWGYHRMVLTKAPYRNLDAWTEKARWCRKHLPDAEVTITTHNKGLNYGDVLYDDWPPYITHWLARHPDGKVLMLDSQFNQGFQHPQVLRCTRDPLRDQAAGIVAFLGIS